MTLFLTFLTQIIAMLACRAQVSYLDEHGKIWHFCEFYCVEVCAKYALQGLQLPWFMKSFRSGWGFDFHVQMVKTSLFGTSIDIANGFLTFSSQASWGYVLRFFKSSTSFGFVT